MSIIAKSFMEFYFDTVRNENVSKRNNVEAEEDEEDERAPPAKRAKRGAEAAEQSQKEFERFATSGLYPLEKPRQTRLFTGTFAEFVARNSNPAPTEKPVMKLSASAPESLEEWFARLSIA